MLEILSGSVANAPTISNSGLWGAKAVGADGYFWSISRLDALLNAFVNLLYYMSKSVKSLKLSRVLTPSAYSKPVIL